MKTGGKQECILSCLGSGSDNGVLGVCNAESAGCRQRCHTKAKLGGQPGPFMVGFAGCAKGSGT